MLKGEGLPKCDWLIKEQSFFILDTLYRASGRCCAQTPFFRSAYLAESASIIAIFVQSRTTFDNFFAAALQGASVEKRLLSVEG